MSTEPSGRLSLSTAYHITKSTSWPALLRETERLGFARLELNVEIPEAYLREAALSVEKGEIIVSSLHNYCPKLKDLPRGRTIYSGYILNSDDEAERKLAVEHTKKTIEWAARLNASAVVLHLGDVPTEPSGREFAKYQQEFGKNGRLYDKYWEAITRDRAKKSRVCLEGLMRGLDKLLPFALEKKIKLGFENRIYYHEMPNIEELSILLDNYKGAPAGYWHDSGHAEIFIRNGWAKSHGEFLAPFKGRTVGMHLHDVKKFSDHYAPGCGDLDFKAITPFVTPDTVLVVEAHAKSSPGEVRASIEYLAKCGIPSN